MYMYIYIYSHLFQYQVAVIDTYKGKEKASPRIRDASDPKASRCHSRSVPATQFVARQGSLNQETNLIPIPNQACLCIGN